MKIIKNMSKQNMKPAVNLFIFRRDLRIDDNKAFNLLCESSQLPIVPIFIFNPLQIDKKKNAYYGSNSFQFMIESLNSLKEQLNGQLNGQLYMFHGYDIQILDKLLLMFSIDTIAYNTDFTPYARSRDQQVQLWAEKRSINIITAEDYTLFDLGTIMTDSKKPYEVFTPFYRKCLAKISLIHKPVSKKGKIWSSKIPHTIKNTSAVMESIPNKNILIHGGRSEALKIITKIKAKTFLRYDTDRDFPVNDKTTKLSAYLKFGCVSIREVFAAVLTTYGVSHGLVRELIWREFYANITHFFPRVISTGDRNSAFKEKYNHLKWHYNQQWLERWKEGRTGVPLVDAAMRQMNVTGWMHNRCRMVVAMFFTKDMMMDWTIGEKYFANLLVDYDPSSNSGGWQWSASVGCDAQPYFRVFNPFTQSEKFDPAAEYIKRWVPELRDVPAKKIHSWNTIYSDYSYVDYPPPMLDHATQAKKAIELFKHV